MRTLLISYDLSRPHRTKHVLGQRIMMLGRWARPLECTWYVQTDHDELDVEALLAPFLDDDDGLLVQRVSAEAVLSNTCLRWFQHRRADVGLARTDNVIAFPLPRPPMAQGELPFGSAVA